MTSEVIDLVLVLVSVLETEADCDDDLVHVGDSDRLSAGEDEAVTECVVDSDVVDVRAGVGDIVTRPDVVTEPVNVPVSVSELEADVVSDGDSVCVGD